MGTRTSPAAFPFLHRTGSGAGGLLPGNGVMWVKGRQDKFLEGAQDRLTAKSVNASAECNMVGSWEGNMLGVGKAGEQSSGCLPLTQFLAPLRQDS